MSAALQSSVIDMKFQIDHDYHIHSQISACSNDPDQTPERVLRYAQDNGLSRIVLTDHFWDSAVPSASNWYKPQDFDRIVRSLPLPQTENVEFLFGAETDMDMNMTIGVADSRWDAFDFVIIPTTHMHMRGFTISEENGATARGRADAWLRRLDTIFSRDLPFHKIGIAHLACGLIAPTNEMYRQTLDLLTDSRLEELFKGCAQVGVGVELNLGDMAFKNGNEDRIIHLFRIAKEAGCKFYCGSDAHHPAEFGAYISTMEYVVSKLGLDESDKFQIQK